jgi:hypothetical protein
MDFGVDIGTLPKMIFIAPLYEMIFPHPPFCDVSFFGSYCSLFVLILPYFAFLLTFYFPFSLSLFFFVSFPVSAKGSKVKSKGSVKNIACEGKNINFRGEGKYDVHS